MNPIEANPAQTISYQLTRKDIIHVWRRRFLKLYLLRALFCLISAALLYGIGFHYLSFLMIAIVSIPPLLFLLAIYFILYKTPTNTNPITLSYTSVGLLQVGSDYRIEIPWSGCKAISEDELYFYLQMTKSNITVKIIPKSAFTPQQIEEFRRCTKTVKEAPAKLIHVEALANRYETDTSSRCDAPLNSVRNQAAPPPIPISAPRRRRTRRVVILVLGVCLVVYVLAKLAMTGYSFYSWVKQFTEIHFTSYEDRFHVKVLKVRSDPDYFMERIRVQCERDMRAGIWVTDLTKAGIFQTNGPNGGLIYHEGNPRKIGQSMVVRAKGRYSTCDIFFTVRTTSTNTVWHAEVAGSSCDTTLPTPMTVTGVQTHWPGAYKRGSEIPLADLGNCKILLSVKDTATDP